MNFLKLCMSAFLLLSTSLLLAADTPKDEKQATSYFEAIISGDVDKANALISVPFSLDRKRIVKTKEEMETVHKQIVATKGKRAVPKYTIAKTDAAPKLDETHFPNYVVFRLKIENDEAVDIYVSVGDTPKVLGFSD